MKQYQVFMERVERYSHNVIVEAESQQEAERIVREADRCDNAFESEWNELQPGVETTYEAVEAEVDK